MGLCFFRDCRRNLRLPYIYKVECTIRNSTSKRFAWSKSNEMVLGIFPRATYQVTISQVATSQMCNFPGSNFQKVKLGLLRRCRLQSRVLRLEESRSRALRLERLGQLPLGKKPIEKYLTSRMIKLSMFFLVWQ